METTPHPSLTRRAFVHQVTAAAACSLGREKGQAESVPNFPTTAPYLTPQPAFVDVSRGEPEPHELTGAAQAEARLTAETWRLEITADAMVEAPSIKVPATLERARTLVDGTAIDLPTLRELGQRHEVHCLKALQCLNICEPLGQGLWTGVPLREVLRSCGKMNNVRRIYFWGYHNNDPKQIFQSSLSYSEVMETPPGEPPVFLAYRLNDEPIVPKRGGPVRMLVPWAHGFKSIKWLQHIFLTNDYRINDTYALQNNDPSSFIKTAAYPDALPPQVPSTEPLTLRGQVIVGRSGLQRVEYWLRPVEEASPKLSDDAEELLRGPWLPCTLQPEPDWKAMLPQGIAPQDVLGFDKITGRPRTWPLRYSTARFAAELGQLRPGNYEIRTRAVDLNNYAQPEPAPAQSTGRNNLLVRSFEVV